MITFIHILDEERRRLGKADKVRLYSGSKLIVSSPDGPTSVPYRTLLRPASSSKMRHCEIIFASTNFISKGARIVPKQRRLLPPNGKYSNELKRALQETFRAEE